MTAGRAPAVLPQRLARLGRPAARATAGSEPSPARDAFPHTRRPLPWVLAAFLAMLFCIPVDSTEVKVHLPVGSQIDRFAIVGMVFAWVCFGGDQRAFLNTRRSKLYVGAACVFLALAVASLLLDAGRIINIGDFELAGKRFALLGSFLVLSWFTLTALRFEDVRGFSTYLIGLATLMAIGMIVERQTGFNAFYNWSGALLKPLVHVAPSPTNIHPEIGSDGRVAVFGPTLSGLAATTMLVVVMPFALVRMFDARSRRSWWLNAIAFALMLAAAAATDRKTALLVPIGVLIYIACYRPRQVLRLAPVGLVVLVGLVHFASPGRARHAVLAELRDHQQLLDPPSRRLHRCRTGRIRPPDPGTRFRHAQPRTARSVPHQRRRVHRRDMGGRLRRTARIPEHDPRADPPLPSRDPLARSRPSRRSRSPRRRAASPISWSTRCSTRCRSRRRPTCSSWSPD